VPSALVIIQSLNVAKVLIQSLDDQDMVEITSDNSQGTKLTQPWTDRNPRNPGNLENRSSNALVLIYCNLHICGNLFAVFPSLLVCLTSPVSAVRQTVVDVISLITSRSTEKTSVLTLGRIVFESSEEIIADETFIAR
jgi:hypothetical protein